MASVSASQTMVSLRTGSANQSHLSQEIAGTENGEQKPNLCLRVRSYWMGLCNIVGCAQKLFNAGSGAHICYSPWA